MKLSGNTIFSIVDFHFYVWGHFYQSCLHFEFSQKHLKDLKIAFFQNCNLMIHGNFLSLNPVNGFVFVKNTLNNRKYLYYVLKLIMTYHSYLFLCWEYLFKNCYFGQLLAQIYFFLVLIRWSTHFYLNSLFWISFAH